MTERLVTLRFPPSVVSEAMFHDFDYDCQSEWGVIPKPTAMERTFVFVVDPEQRERLLDLVLERCCATYRCNDDRQQMPISAWTWLKRRYGAEIAERGLL